ncbi:hypothetical protein NXH58_03070 [Agathobacter ruminis]|uniref:hypothetical protein n=1 Tax=Agathobacter ruminis TaxID=1712665 RepID=UPI00234DEC03|nr:hypothetical protein [Agathobacter ruminis]MDC7300772.1 hypothetical protein [Agathobacter ruminis]
MAPADEEPDTEAVVIAPEETPKAANKDGLKNWWWWLAAAAAAVTGKAVYDKQRRKATDNNDADDGSEE